MPSDDDPDLREEYRKINDTLQGLLAVQAMIRADVIAAVGLGRKVAQAAGVETIEGVPVLDWFTRTRKEEIEAHLAKLAVDSPVLAAMVRQRLASELP